ncbi:MAG: hypothetical protein ACK4JY_10275 [Brevundimonas sp.]|uniref:hypothetical protein n=1 Tax=Brevundimonas sp. TaxID=1871086 RepID=UPI00391BB41D
MKAIAVVEREYGSKLHVAGGVDTPLFNRMTRLSRDFGGNEYDAAAMFMVADMAARLRCGMEERMGSAELLGITNLRLPLMRQPAVVLDVIERTLDATKAAVPPEVCAGR